MNGRGGKLNKLLTYLPKEAYFVLGMSFILVIVFTILRASFYFINSHFLPAGDSDLLIGSFMLGFYFDLSVISYIVMVYFFILAMVIKPKSRSIALSVFTFFLSIFLLVLVGEAEFYSLFETRYNYTILREFEDMKGLFYLIWEGYPVFMYSLLWLILVLILTSGQSFLFHALLRDYPPYGETGVEVFKRGLVGFAIFLVIFTGSRGGVGEKAISCTDGKVADSKFLSDLTLNGAFTLGSTIIDNESEGCISQKQVVPNIIILPKEDPQVGLS